MPTTENNKYAFILGSHPELSYAELKAVLELQKIEPVDLRRQENITFITTTSPLDHNKLMERLGGTIKIVQVVGAFEEDAVVEWLFEQINHDTKFNFGFSIYATESGIPIKKHWKQIKHMGLSIKKALKADDISCRFVEAREVQLSSVIVHKERLLKNGAEIVLFKGKDQLTFGKTLAVQPFQDFSKRDYGRPQRDVRSGMLPPKIARIMINLAKPQPDATILDPFCGSGTILQEALLMKYKNVIGSDISRQAVADSRKNLNWLELPEILIHASRAERLVKDGIVKKKSIDCIIFEGYLGPPSPAPKQIPRIQKDLQNLYQEVFKEFQSLLSPDGIIVAALPFWNIRKQEHYLNSQKILTAGKFQPINAPLYYRRPQQTVGREIIIAQ